MEANNGDGNEPDNASVSSGEKDEAIGVGSVARGSGVQVQQAMVPVQ